MATSSVPYNANGMVVVTHVYPQQGAQGSGHVYPQQGAQGSGHVYPQQGAQGSAHVYPQQGAQGSAHVYPQQGAQGSAHVYPQQGAQGIGHVYPQQGAQGIGLPQTGVDPGPSSHLHRFLKGEPSILGTVQIMIGIVTFLFGIVGAFNPTLSIIGGIPFWGGTIYITAGSLTVRAYKKLSSCMVKASLGMNIISSITAGVAIILHSLDFIVPVYYYYCDSYSCYRLQSRLWGTVGVMLVLSILQFIVSICVSAFGCKATCTGEAQPVMYITNQIPASLLTVPPPTTQIPAPLLTVPPPTTQIPAPLLTAPPHNTSELAHPPATLLAPAHHGHAESAPTGQFGELPPKYSPA